MSVNEKMTAIANAVRGKTGGAALLTLDEIADAIEALEVGGGDVEAVEQATPTISVSSSGLITASATQQAGMVSGGTKSATKQLTTQAAKTVTPSSSSQTAVASGIYTTGAVTVAAVPTETKTATPSTSQQSITPSSGKFLSKVTVNAIPSTYVKPSGTKTITANGTNIDVKNYQYVTVNVASSGGSVKYYNAKALPSVTCNTVAFFEVCVGYSSSQSFIDTYKTYYLFVDVPNKRISATTSSEPPCSQPSTDFSSGTYSDMANGYLVVTYSGTTLAFTITDSSKCELDDPVRGFYS